MRKNFHPALLSLRRNQDNAQKISYPTWRKYDKQQSDYNWVDIEVFGNTPTTPGKPPITTRTVQSFGIHNSSNSLQVV
jgi:hypothetical protein